MKLYTYEATQTIPFPLPQVWTFFSNVNNLSKITPPHLGFKSEHIGKDEVHPGMIITHTITPFPFLNLQWITEITHVQVPFFFVDEQRFGPYRFWHHQHHFSETPQGTLISDLIHYALPLGWFGQMTHPWFVRPQLDSIFRYRNQMIKSQFPNP